MPTLDGAEGFTAATVAWWKTIWASPMAELWIGADVPGLARLAGLIDLANRGQAKAALLGEIRQLEDRFGLSPVARRRLEWEVSRAPLAAVPDPEPDEERFVRAVRD